MKAFVLSGGENPRAGRLMLRSVWQSISTVTRFGLILGGLGVAADFVHHGFMHHVHFEGVLHIELFGHVLTLVGMVFALSGVARAAVESRRRTREKGGNDAARIGAAAPQ
jgi:hypothetical protein